MWLVPEKGEIRYRESFVIVTVGWFLVSLFGSLPFLLSGVCTSFSDAFLNQFQGLPPQGRLSLLMWKYCPGVFSFGEA